ncbi:baculoviral IAP repeat-containing protein 7 [Varanus komodoensis]|uniref:baculoviral IAP repeat-containing protein 7 n=1 Tax=Varanus komodoensis TaxID=61221 RepID=UPI001CF7CE62|nr:baculoviral IAP repeat-containing protein 7 [Varanus komodoensis]
MQAADGSERLIVQHAVDALRALFSRMESSLSPEQTHSRGGNSFPGKSRSKALHQAPSVMRSEERRLQTFQRWPESAPVSPRDLAAAGFFFTGPDDRVKCFCCEGVLYDWHAQDDPVAEHRKFFPTCPFIQAKEARPLLMPSMEEIQDCVDGQFLGTLQSLSMEEATVDSQPEYPDLEAEGSRLRTFQNWPSYARVCPEVLAGAGFFYTGEGDFVRCFYCDGALRNWERGDDPWMEHARWFPRCKFLLQSRGRDFIDSIQESYLSPPVSQAASFFPSVQRLASSQEPAQEEQGLWRTRREAETEHPNRPDASLSLEEKLRRLQEERMCKVCMDKDVAIVLVPCGHLVVCAECAPNLRRCPICRGVIRDTMKAFLS